MLEIITRKFRLEEGEDIVSSIDTIKRMPGYLSGTIQVINHTEIIADSYTKVMWL